jgi:hypothetical protein
MKNGKVVVPEAPKLPAGIEKADLKYPDHKEKDSPKDIPYEDHQFEIWFVPNYGWCIPTLHISNGGSRRAYGTAPRTYAVAIDTGKVVRIGLGPHVQQRSTVYVRQSRIKDLQKFLDLRTKGAGDANQIRDRISTRRAQGAMYRMNRGW